ncbi:MAG: BLUF domain-containing protein, partial [Rhodoferax sp.]|nr:BLUF domain-containing protein [Rhodoferax sp.]
MDLHELTYCSRATHEMSPAELSELLEQAREHNARHGITGLLVYRQQEFMQLLEGDRNVIFALYGSICADPRNRRNYLMWDEPITQRAFPDWGMAFLSLDGIDLLGKPGYSDFLDAGFSSVTRNA